jgi:aminodeoxyfutalosine synthase
MKLPDNITNRRLKDIAQKVYSNAQVNFDDAVYMLQTNDILDLGTIANFIRTKLHKNRTFYGVNMNLNYTNICELRCPLCAFSCDKEDKKAYLFSIKEIEKKVREAVDFGIDEIHIVGGLHPELKLDYFEQMLKTIKKIKPDINIVAFTAVEYHYFATLNNISVEEVLKRLIKAGVNTLPGGGAEIFAPEVRNIIAPKKISGEQWLKIMEKAHKMGLKTNATMLYNHKESIEDIADHLLKLRNLQNKTNGFKTFVPLQFHSENTQITTRKSTTGFDDIRIYATARIFFPNIPHIKALWMYVGDKMAQVLQKFGVDDIGATYHNEKVVHAAGATTPDFGTEKFLKRLITTAGFVPKRTTASYKLPQVAGIGHSPQKN